MKIIIPRIMGQRDNAFCKHCGFRTLICLYGLTYRPIAELCTTLLQSNNNNNNNNNTGDWFHAPPITAIGLRLTNEMIRVAVGFRLGTNTCEPHQCVCGTTVDARGLHGLCCGESAPTHQRHSHMNDIIWRAVKRAQIPVVKEPVGLSMDGGKT